MGLGVGAGVRCGVGCVRDGGAVEWREGERVGCGGVRAVTCAAGLLVWHKQPR